MKESHADLPSNYELSDSRLNGLLRRLQQNPDILEEYVRDLSCKSSFYAFLISLSFQAATLYRMPTSFGNQEEQ